MSATVGKPNVKGGKGYKRGKTRRARATKNDITLDIEGGEGYYGTVTKLYGGNRVEVKLHDGTITQATIPGRMYKKQWIKPGFTVMINNEYEILKIVRDHDKDAKEANMLLQKSSGTDNLFSDVVEPEEGNDEIAEVLGKELKKPEMKEKLVRKTNDKERDLSRRTGKQFSNPEDLEENINIDEI